MHSFILTQPIDGAPSTIQIVYPSHDLGDDHLANGMDQIIEGYNRRLVPSRLLFVCTQPMAPRLEATFDKQRERFEERLQSVSHVTIAPYDHHGRLIPEEVKHLNPPAAPWEIDDALLLNLARQGIAILFEDTETILHAPHGYSFRKPSGREEDIFVRAGNMLRQPAALAIFNHLLLRHLPADCSILYIDSFTILSFAMGLQSLAAHFNRTPHPLPPLAIESIHSYDISDDVWIPNEDNYLVLISASTSGGLADKLVAEYQADSSRIVHLLGVAAPDAPFQDSCVYFHPRPSNAGKPNPADQVNASIEIRTEEFLVSQGPPRPVRITTTHVDDRAARRLHEPFYTEALRFGPSSGSASSRSYSPFSINSTVHEVDDSSLRAWVSEHLIHELPASVGTLLYVAHPMAKQVAEWTADQLRLGVVAQPLDQLDANIEDSSSTNTIAVIAYDDPDLEDLARASIELRRLPHVHRHYVVCYGFPASRVDYERRRSDLRMAPDGRRHRWSEFLILPVGAPSLHDSLTSYRQLLTSDNLQLHASAFGDDLHSALLRQGPSQDVCSHSLFLPRTSGDPLALRQGSVFLPCSTAEGVSQVSIYAMVSGALQTAREPQSARLEPTSGFDDNPFVRSVLDPSMFARYSDGILQASLLRAAKRSELDYSASDDLSQQFASTFESVIVNHTNSVGDAALEFVYAFATDKVSLRKPDRQRLQTDISSNTVLHSFFELCRSTDPVSDHLGT